MLCERCNKNEATFHKSVYINGKGYEVHLCHSCAKDIDFDIAMDADIPINLTFDNFDDNFESFKNHLIDEFFDIDNLFHPTMRLEENSKRCPECKSSFNDFLRRGKLGCNKCYDTFNNEIRDMLENMDNPTDFTLEIGTELNKLEPTELEKLNIEYNRAIEEERYEDAGELKKKINCLSDKNDKKENV